MILDFQRQKLHFSFLLTEPWNFAFSELDPSLTLSRSYFPARISGDTAHGVRIVLMVRNPAPFNHSR
jgi:hypothetical protein